MFHDSFFESVAASAIIAEVLLFLWEVRAHFSVSIIRVKFC